MSLPLILTKLPDSFETINVVQQQNMLSSPNINSTVIYWVSQPISPNETVLAIGANIDTSSTISLIILPNSQVTSPFNVGSLSSLSSSANKPIQITTTTIKFIIPSQYQQGVYAYSVINSSSIPSTYFYINLPDVWFVQGDQGRTASPGGKIFVVGTSLALINGSNTYSPTLALVDINNNVTLISADSTWNSNVKIADYYQSFTVPSTVTLGTYSLYYHNGYGGNYTWSAINTFRSGPTPSTIVGMSIFPILTPGIPIAATVSWPTTIVKMSAPVSGGTDDAHMAIAIASLTVYLGGILIIPAGTYNFNSPIILPPNVTVIGSGMSTTILNWITTPTFPSSNPVHGLIMGKNLMVQGYWGWAKFSISNLSITTTNIYIGNAISIIGNHSNDFSYIRNVTINLTQGTTSATTTIGIYIAQTENVEISNCIISSTTNIYLLNVTYARIFNNILNYGARNIQNEASWNTINLNNNFYFINGYGFDNGIYGITFSGASGNITSDNFVGNNVAQNHDTLGAFMSFDNEQGAFVGSGVIANGTLLTFPSALPGAGNPGGGHSFGVVMILSGTGVGQWRYIANGTTVTSTSLNVVSTWTINPDINSIISVVGLCGRTILAGNTSLLGGGWNYAYYATLDVIQANNTTTSDAASTYIGDRNNSIQPGWHHQVLGNYSQPSIYFSPTTGTYLMIATSVSASPAANYSNYQIYRNNIMESTVLGGIYIQASQPVGNIIIEHNNMRVISFTATTSTSITNSIVRGNIISGTSASPLIISYNPTTLTNSILSL